MAKHVPAGEGTAPSSLPCVASLAADYRVEIEVVASR
jgi:hypothetical protein